MNRLFLARHQLIKIKACASPTQAGGQFVFNRAPHRQPVAPFADAVPLVGKQQVFNRLAQFLQPSHHIVRILFKHPNVIAAVYHQQWRIYFV